MAEHSQAQNLSIGEVVAHLKARWPEVTPSMIRFWEREGLIQPGRTEGGHRLYCGTDLQRLELIADLRQRRYMPLAAVKHILAGLESDPTFDVSLFEEIFRPESYDPDFEPLSARELAECAGLSPRQIKAFERAGFFSRPESGDSPRRYDEDDLRVAHLLAELLQAGFEAGDLAFYADDIAAHVAHEVDLLARAFGACPGTVERRALYRRLQRTLGELRARLYRTYNRAAVRALLEKD